MNLIKLNIPRTLSLLVLFFLTTASSFAVEDLVPSLSISINGEKIANGSCVNGPRDFSKTKFQIVDQNGKGLSYFQIIQGNVLPSQSDRSMRGTISEAGTLDAAGVELLKNAEGERMTVFVKVLDKSNNSTIGLTFQFFVNVTPDIVLGNITQGQKDVEMEILTSMESLYIEFSENPKLISFKVVSGSIVVDGIKIKGKVLENGVLDENALKILSESAGKQVTVLVVYSEPSGVEKRTALVFTVAA
jgi:hypothetical protein